LAACPLTIFRLMMQPTEILGLTVAAVAAGAVNAVAGGGTLLTFPTLLLFGTPAVVANATSTLALTVGNFGSVYGYRRYFHGAKPWLWRFVPVSLLGGWIGSVLLTKTGNEIFARLVPFLILFATVLFLTQGIFRRMAGPDDRNGRPVRPRTIAGAVLFQFGVAVYGGYFGAGIGILMLASLGLIGLSDIHEMNTIKTVLSALINLVASAWFMGAGLIDWPKAGVMTIGALAGYYLGSHYAQRISQSRVRQIIAGIGFVLSAVTFYRQFGR
jgi:uncharacterized membrane protein YfcA